MISDDRTDRVALAVIGLLTEQHQVRLLARQRRGQGASGRRDVRARQRAVAQMLGAVRPERDRLVQCAHRALGPIVTATISDPSTAPPSRIANAASIA
jgi:hypothetical protein